jgi:serine/threonine protein kinase
LDFCPGGDISELLNRHLRLNEDVAKIYLAEIVLALEYLHKKNIIYRDLKPENVVLDEDGHANLTDFGLSKENMEHNQ